jgi:glutamate decarboxylase
VREGFSADLGRSLRDDMTAVLAHLDDIKPGGYFDNQRHFAH